MKVLYKTGIFCSSDNFGRLIGLSLPIDWAVPEVVPSCLVRTFLSLLLIQKLEVRAVPSNYVYCLYSRSKNQYLLFWRRLTGWRLSEFAPRENRFAF